MRTVFIKRILFPGFKMYVIFSLLIWKIKIKEWEEFFKEKKTVPTFKFDQFSNENLLH